MKYLFSLLFLFISFNVFAQEPPYTPMRLNYQFRGIRVDSLFLIPNYADTSAANGSLSKRIPGSFIRTGNDFWMRNADTSAWLQNVNVGSGASPIVTFINSVFKKSGTDSIFVVESPSDTLFAYQDLGVDTTSLSNRINLKVDSLKRSSDSIYFKKNGIWFFSYKDSLGQSQNFANTNLRATGNRTHSFANYGLAIDSVSDFNVQSKQISRFSQLRLLNGNFSQFSYNYSNGNTTSIESWEDSLQVGGYDGALNFYGNVSNLSNGTVSLRRGNNRALLSMRNFGTDTIALKSDITGGADSPDRINGTATDAVTADMNGDIIRFTDASQWKIDNTGQVNIEADSGLTLMSESMFHKTQSNKYEFKDFNNTFLRIDTLGNFEAGDLTTNQLTIALSKNDSAFQIKSKAPSTWREGNSGLTSQVKTGYPKNDIDLSTGNYEIKLPGVYSVVTAHATNTLTLPNPSDWGGQSITIINKDIIDIIYAGGIDPYIYDGTQISTQWALSIATLYSDGNVWFALYNK